MGVGRQVSSYQPISSGGDGGERNENGLSLDDGLQLSAPRPMSDGDGNSSAAGDVRKRNVSPPPAAPFAAPPPSLDPSGHSVRRYRV